MVNWSLILTAPQDFVIWCAEVWVRWMDRGRGRKQKIEMQFVSLKKEYFAFCIHKWDECNHHKKRFANRRFFPVWTSLREDQSSKSIRVSFLARKMNTFNIIEHNRELVSLRKNGLSTCYGSQSVLKLLRRTLTITKTFTPHSVTRTKL